MTSLEALHPGTVIAGRYRVQQELGRGGWGVVLAAVDERGTEVAIKVLTADLTEADVLPRFHREAAVVRALHSAHVCRVFEMGSLDDGSPFIVMERLHGEDLGQRLDRLGRLELARAVDYLLQTCDAVAEAHLGGVVHRDLKPSNLFLAAGPAGEQIRVLDFGIAKARNTSLRTLTDVGAVLGSPHYIAPEQLASSRDVAPTADIWSLGVTFFELLTNETAFRGHDVPSLFRAVLKDPPVALRSLRPDMPAEVEAIVERCLQKLPDHRYASVAELVTALRPFASPAGAVYADRIVALSSRRLAQTADTMAGPTAAEASFPGSAPYAGPTAVGPTAVAPTTVGPTVAGPTVAGPTVAGPTVAGPTAGGAMAGPTMAAPTLASAHPRSPPQPTSSAPTALSPALSAPPPPRRTGVMIAAFAGMAVLAIGAGLVIARMAQPARSSKGPAGATTVTRVEGCAHTTCDIRIDPNNAFDPDLLPAVRRLVLERAPEAALASMSFYGVAPDGSREGLFTNVYSFNVDEGQLKATVRTDGTTLTPLKTSTMLRPPPLPNDYCSLKQALSSAAPHLTPGHSMATLARDHYGVRWSIQKSDGNYVILSSRCKVTQTR